jgi:hypothetical protein
VRFSILVLPLQRVAARPAVALTAPVETMTAEQRAALATELGYKSIGAELPNDVSLTDIVKTMPPEVVKIGRIPVCCRCDAADGCD